MEEGETLEHFHHRFSDYLGVSVKIMKSVYNRSSPSPSPPQQGFLNKLLHPIHQHTHTHFTQA